MRMRKTTGSIPVKLLLTMAEAAEALSLSRTKLYALVMCGTIFSVKVGRRRLVPVIALERFVDQQMAAQEVS
jgi:excisionase family DNA binding protein